MPPKPLFSPPFQPRHARALEEYSAPLLETLHGGGEHWNFISIFAPRGKREIILSPDPGGIPAPDPSLFPWLCPLRPYYLFVFSIFVPRLLRS